MGWNKLHAVIGIRTRVIIDYMVTPGNVADVTAMRIMLGRLAAGPETFAWTPHTWLGKSATR